MRATKATVRELSKQDTQFRVLRAADELFQEQGFSATTIRDVAAAADVSVGSVMAVGDKRSLLVTIFDRLIEGFHHNREVASDCSVSATGQIMDLLAPFIEAFTGRPELARAYASILVGGDHTSAVFTDLADTLVREISVVLGEDVPCSANKARAVYLAYLGWLFAWAGGMNERTRGIDELRETVTIICSHH